MGARPTCGGTAMIEMTSRAAASFPALCRFSLDRLPLRRSFCKADIRQHAAFRWTGEFPRPGASSVTFATLAAAVHRVALEHGALIQQPARSFVESPDP